MDFDQSEADSPVGLVACNTLLGPARWRWDCAEAFESNRVFFQTIATSAKVTRSRPSRFDR